MQLVQLVPSIHGVSCERVYKCEDGATICNSSKKAVKMNMYISFTCKGHFLHHLDKMILFDIIFVSHVMN